jgi:apolipoprotein N-acyltransferase
VGAKPLHDTLVTGAARAGQPLPGESNPPIFNSIQVITRAGGVVASYDKHHLVPFGEYLPGVFDDLIRSVGLTQFVAVPGGFTAAPVRRTLVVPGLPPVAATICYEAIFPGAVLPHAAESAARRPRLILNVTNDAWFGMTPGPHQHLAQARLRAVEEGLPLIRAANNGVSAVIDPYGRITGQLALGTDGVLDAGLPQAISPTTFSRVGHAPAWAGILLFLIAPGVARVRRRRAG